MIDFKKLVAALRKLGDGSNFDRPLKASEMTLRDYFAAKAMQGWCSMTQSSDWTEEELARDSYVIADAMLEARK